MCDHRRICNPRPCNMHLMCNGAESCSCCRPAVGAPKFVLITHQQTAMLSCYHAKLRHCLQLQLLVCRWGSGDSMEPLLSEGTVNMQPCWHCPLNCLCEWRSVACWHRGGSSVSSFVGVPTPLPWTGRCSETVQQCWAWRQAAPGSISRWGCAFVVCKAEVCPSCQQCIADKSSCPATTPIVNS